MDLQAYDNTQQLLIGKFYNIRWSEHVVGHMMYVNEYNCKLCCFEEDECAL